MTTAVLAVVAGCGWYLLHSYSTGSNSLREQYRLGESLENSGNASDALEIYANAYARGRPIILRFLPKRTPPASLEAPFINIAYRYAWFLLNIGERDKAIEVLNTLKKLTQKTDLSSLPPSLVLPYARLMNLVSRFASDQKQPELAKKYSLKAVYLISKPEILSSSDLDTNYTVAAMFANQALDTTGRQKQELYGKVCDLANRMMTEAPLDTRAIDVFVTCWRNHPHTTDLATKDLLTARAAVLKGLTAEPRNSDLLLLMSQIEGNLAAISPPSATSSARNEHQLAAKAYFVKCLAGRTVLERHVLDVKNTYALLRNTALADTKKKIAYYTDIAKSVEQSRLAFPKSTSFAYVSADASAQSGLLLSLDSSQRQLATVDISKAINLFTQIGILKDLSHFSEGFETYCGLYRLRSDLYAQSGQLELMQSDVKQLTSSCTAVLNKYPWDFYLRMTFVEAEGLAGENLFKSKRYKDALPYLEYASHWGVSGSSKSLSQMYREGLGATPDAGKARELAALADKQRTVRFTIPADFGGIKGPFDIYVREWPVEYPFTGIDDQVNWLKNTRGGTIDPNIAEGLRKLQKIARQNNVSYASLCEYAFAHGKR